MAWACCLLPSFPATSHDIAPMADPSWCTGHCAPVLCVGILVRVSFSLGAIRPWHCAHGFISWLTAQGLGALVPVRGGGRPHHALCHCGHGVHTTHVVEPMCACLSRVVCLRHAQGLAMVPPWYSQGFVPPLSHLSPAPLKSNTGGFHCFWRRHQYA